MAISLTHMAMSCYAGGKLPRRQALYHTNIETGQPVYIFGEKWNVL